MAMRLYPQVAVSKYAIPKTMPVVEESTAPIMFVPFRSEKGPANEFKMIYTLNEFVSVYGENTFDNSDKEHDLLNISNWLTAGGALLALRLADETYEHAETSDTIGNIKVDDVNYTVKFEAKYPGIAYKNTKIRITKSSGGLIFTVIQNNTQLERFTIYNSVNDIAAKIDTLSQYIRIVDDEYTDLKPGTKLVGCDHLIVEDVNGDVKIKKSDLNSTHTVTNNKLICKVTKLVDGSQVTEDVIIATVDSSDDTYYYLSDYKISASTETKTVKTSDFLRALMNVNKFNTESIVFDSDYDNTSVKLYNFTLDFILTTYGDYSRPDSSRDVMLTKFFEAGKMSDADYASSTGFKKTSYELIKQFKNKLESPCDLVMDASYPDAIKKELILLADDRDDVHFYIDIHENGNEVEQASRENQPDVLAVLPSAENENSELKNADGEDYDCANISYYSQYFVVTNPYTNNDIKVGATYFLSQLVAENDIKYGIQKPSAGRTRGVLTGVKSISSNPDPVAKETFYENQINYVEKDSRGHYFMCQLTKDTRNTALKYVNNSRTINWIAREIEAIGRKYLFEFNDTTTLTLMKNEMNKYMSEWVQNRTLNYVELNVESEDDTRVNVSLNVRFVGTIEIIAVAITIE